MLSPEYTVARYPNAAPYEIYDEEKAKDRIKHAEIVEKLGKHLRVEKAIFFGSRARDDWLESSDVDTILVSPDFEGVLCGQDESCSCVLGVKI